MSSDKQKTIMSVGAHHDDNELVGGTLAKHKQAGWRVVTVVMTDGMYIGGKASKEHIPIRDAESQSAADMLGAEYVCLHFREGNFQPTDESRYALMAEIRKYRPDIVITHSPNDYHMDHISTSRCALEALHMSWNPCVDSELPVCEMPKLYYADTWFVPFEPDEYIDISDVIELKLNLLRCHKSQANTAGRTEDDMVELARLKSLMRGLEAGVEYAEAFRLVPTMGAVRINTLLT